VTALTGLGIAVLALVGCQDRPMQTEASVGEFLQGNVTAGDGQGRHVVVFAAERVPGDFAARVAGLGGAVESALDSIGVAVVTGLTEAAAHELAAAADVRAVEPDPITAAPAAVFDDDIADQPGENVAAADATSSPTAAQFYPRQWNLRAVFAPEAWAAGHLGSRDVVVAILDTGIDYLHPDFVGLVDLDRSASFVPEAVPARYAGRLPISDFHQHGTFVASIIASNAQVLAGVNRYVTLIAVKVADSTNRSSAGRMLSGIVYAADQGADVINLSNGVQRDRSADPGTVVAFERAVSYAFRKGALLVAPPFNDAADLDHNGNRVRLPCEVSTTICASATAPTGAAGVNGPWENVDAFAPYSGFGRSAVDVAAPGGAGAPNRNVWLPCTTTPTQSTGRPECRARQAIAQSRGTSFATPHVAGLAALLVAQLGRGNLALIRARILDTADDLGNPGMDPYYGHGRINVARALGVVD
jgi:subtilisin family serine protease